jgi:hypothetical protein
LFRTLAAAASWRELLCRKTATACRTWKPRDRSWFKSRGFARIGARSAGDLNDDNMAESSGKAGGHDESVSKALVKM